MTYTKDAGLQALLDNNKTQTQEQFTKALSSTTQCISKRLHAMRKIQKVGK